MITFGFGPGFHAAVRQVQQSRGETFHAPTMPDQCAAGDALTSADTTWDAYYVGRNNVDGSAELMTLDMSTGDATSVETYTATTLHCLAYHPSGALFAVQTAVGVTPRKLLRFRPPLWEKEDLGTIADLPHVFCGVCDKNGQFWVSAADGTMYRVAVDTPAIAETLTLDNASAPGSDMALDFASGLIYSLLDSSTTLGVIDVLEGAVTTKTVSGITLANYYGLQWIAGDTMYVVADDDFKLYSFKYRESSPVATLIATLSISAAAWDGASSYFAGQ